MLRILTTFLCLLYCVMTTVIVWAADNNMLRASTRQSLNEVDKLLGDKSFQQDIDRQQEAIHQLSPKAQAQHIEKWVHGEASAQQQITSTLEKAHKEIQTVRSDEMAGSRLLVIVSLSLPDDLLKHYFAQAKRVGATIVFRGFKDNDYLQMKQAMADKGLTEAYQVDPITVKKYGITSVPAMLLLVNDEHPCQGMDCPLLTHIKAEGVVSINDFLSKSLGYGKETDKVVRQWQGR